MTESEDGVPADVTITCFVDDPDDPEIFTILVPSEEARCVVHPRLLDYLEEGAPAGDPTVPAPRDQRG